ncbi:MAG: ATP phosphoribosyltransferase [Candidatus Bathyarchaeia archaeon]
MGILRFALPKGHLWARVKDLLDQAGYGLRVKDERSYLVGSNDPELELRIHRAQNISPLVEEGRYDIGITGYDWVVEHNADVEELLDLGVGKVDIIAAVPQRYELEGLGENEALGRFIQKIKEEGKERIIAASEYENITANFCRRRFGAFPYKFIRSYGATETFIGAADLIVDCTETGATLQANGWQVISKIFSSTARLIANRQSLRDDWKREKIEGVVELVKGAMAARGMKLIKMNVSADALEGVLSILPSMKSPTISRLAGGGDAGYAVEVAVSDEQVLHLIPTLKRKGATDILEIDIKKVVR